MPVLGLTITKPPIKGGTGLEGWRLPAAHRMSTALRDGDSAVLTRSLPALFTFSSCTRRSASSSCSSWDRHTYSQHQISSIINAGFILTSSDVGMLHPLMLWWNACKIWKKNQTNPNQTGIAICNFQSHTVMTPNTCTQIIFVDFSWVFTLHSLQ